MSVRNSISFYYSFSQTSLFLQQYLDSTHIQWFKTRWSQFLEETVDIKIRARSKKFWLTASRSCNFICIKRSIEYAWPGIIIAAMYISSRKQLITPWCSIINYCRFSPLLSLSPSFIFAILSATINCENFTILAKWHF